MKKLFLILILYKLGNLSAQNLCNGNLGAPIENTNFGTGAIGTHTTLPAAAGATTTYTHVTAAPGAAEYVISASFNGNAAWHIANDRTNPNTGRTMIINANTGAGIFYSKTISGLIPNTNYEFGAYVANLLRNTYVGATVVQPNISFTVYNLTKTSTIATVNTGTIASTANLDWKKYGTTFNSGTNTSVVLEISNVQAGTNGNDFALDDITLSPCLPSFEEIETCISDNPLLLSANNITWNSNSNISYSGSNAYFNTSTSGEGVFEVISSSKAYRITVVNCCEDPCSWSKTGNDNINSGHFLGTRNNADLNFRTNNSLNMKLGVSGHLTLDEGKSLMFGKITGNSTNNRWGIEEFDGGLNFWKPWPTTNSGNYNMFLSNDGKVGIQIGNTPLWGKALGWNWHKFQVRGWGLSDGWATFSDERLKKNFRKIEKPTQTLMAIKAYQYDYNIEQFDNQSVNSDKVENKQKMTEINGLTKRYGFKAQEVEKILPDLVHNPTSEEGFKSMDYDGFIPILIEAFKELNAKVEKQNNAVVENEELKAKIAVMEEKFALLEKTITQLCESGCEGLKNLGTRVPESSSGVDVLFQSIPNPTDSEALINYHLSREYRDASITVSSQDGKQLMSLKLDTKKGAGSIKLSLGEFSNGTYLYTLVAGERVIDTKRLQIIK